MSHAVISSTLDGIPAKLPRRRFLTTAGVSDKYAKMSRSYLLDMCCGSFFSILEAELIHRLSVGDSRAVRWRDINILWERWMDTARNCVALFLHGMSRFSRIADGLKHER